MECFGVFISSFPLEVTNWCSAYVNILRLLPQRSCAQACELRTTSNTLGTNATWASGEFSLWGVGFFSIIGRLGFEFDTLCWTIISATINSPQWHHFPIQDMNAVFKYDGDVNRRSKASQEKKFKNSVCNIKRFFERNRNIRWLHLKSHTPSLVFHQRLPPYPPSPKLASECRLPAQFIWGSSIYPKYQTQCCPAVGLSTPNFLRIMVVQDSSWLGERVLLINGY